MKNSIVNHILLVALSGAVFMLLVVNAVAAAPVLYVVTGANNTLEIIDTASDTVTGKIGELNNAHGLAGNANTEYLVAGSLNAGQGGDATATKLPAKPAGMSEDVHKSHHSKGDAGAAPAGKSYVSVIHRKHGHVMRQIEVSGATHHTAVSPDGVFAVAVQGKEGGISVIDINGSKVIAFVRTGKMPNYAVFDADGDFLYVSNTASGTVSVIDTHRWQLIENIKVGSGPAHMYLNGNTRTLYVVNAIAGSVSAVDLVSRKNTKEYQVGMSPHGVAMSTNGMWLFVSNKAENTLTRINVNSDAIKNIALAPAPYHVAALPHSEKLYVSSRKAPKIWVIDQRSMNVLDEITIDSGVAHQMVFIDR